MAFPVTTAVQAGPPPTAHPHGVGRDTLPDWLAAWLDRGSGWCDGVLLSLALRPGADLAALDDLARAMCLSSERLTETLEQGAAFAGNIAALGGDACATDHPCAAPFQPTLPIAVGRACAAFPLPPAEIIAQFLQAQMAALISAAVRFLPLGPLQGQRMLAAMQPAILATAARAATADAGALATATWGADIAAMRHETMTVRIFRS